MTQAKSGDTVKVHYTGRLMDGTEFDSSRDRDPLEFKLGEGQVIAGFDDAIEGMDEGESKTVTIPPDQGYGEHRDDLVAELDKGQFPGEKDPEVGMRLQLTTEGGETIGAWVTEVGDDTFHVDANHPLAGKDLVFEIELVGVDQG